MKLTNKCVEYTNLNYSAHSKEIKKFVKLAIERNYRSVVVTYNNAGLAKRIIKQSGSDLKVVVVIGFPPHGYKWSILDDYKDDFDEIDMLLPTDLYYYNYPPFLEQIKALIEYAKKKLTSSIVGANGKPIVKPLKLILETALMRAKDMQIKELCKLAKESGIDVIKTNTGLLKRKKFDDLVEDVQIIKKYWKGPIKASGGIKTKEDAEKVIKAGATLVGVSSDILNPSPPVSVSTAVPANNNKGEKK